MEPFRIPFAGKIDVCCFDKTGTLTGEDLVVQGLAGIAKDNPMHLTTELELVPKTAIMTMATCHSLFRVKETTAGDPMEKATLEFIDWELAPNDSVATKNAAKSRTSCRILKRFPFSSALKRMSCIAQAGTSPLFAAVKGAPEIIRERLETVPTWYDEVFTKYARTGARVLALATKLVSPNMTSEQIRDSHRDVAETGLTFAGFLVFHCPIKPDSKAALRALMRSSHKVAMITGDNPLTAIHVAQELEMVRRPMLLVDVDEQTGKIMALTASDMSTFAEFEETAGPDKVLAIAKEFDFAFTGDALEQLYLQNPRTFNMLLPLISVHARASPSQKELILNSLKSQGLTTLMCGDGTNDVGALKQAHVGVALLDGRPEDLPKILKQMQELAMKKRLKDAEESRKKWEAKLNAKFGVDSQANNAREANQRAQKVLDNMASSMDDNETPMVRLGDASVAAPFTSKISTIEAVCNIVRQGRCTLVTTIQMYKILALNSLISAYSLSVLHLEGIRYGDFQVTVTGMLLAGCFLFLSRAQPVKKLSKQRPQPNIFNAYLVLSVLLQFALHIASMVFIMRGAQRFSFPRKPEEVPGKSSFEPGLLNTAVYLMSQLMQVSTFVVNYQGRPFRESLYENKPLRNALAIVAAIAIVAATEVFPEFNEWIELVPLPPTFRARLIGTMAVDLGGCLLIEWVSKKIFFDSRPRVALDE